MDEEEEELLERLEEESPPEVQPLKARSIATAQARASVFFTFMVLMHKKSVGKQDISFIRADDIAVMFHDGFQCLRGSVDGAVLIHQPNLCRNKVREQEKIDFAQ